MCVTVCFGSRSWAVRIAYRWISGRRCSWPPHRKLSSRNFSSVLKVPVRHRNCTNPNDTQPYLQVDFWEVMLMASSQEAVIQELLFRLASVYIDWLTDKHKVGYTPQRTTRTFKMQAAEERRRSGTFLSDTREMPCDVWPPPKSTAKKCSEICPACLFVSQMNSCSDYGALYLWLTALNQAKNTSSQHQEALYKLQVIYQ